MVITRIWILGIMGLFGLQFNLIGEYGQPYSVALHPQQIGDSSGAMNGKTQLVHRSAFARLRKIHGGGVIDDELAAQVGLLFVTFYKELVGTTEKPPVDVACRLTGIIKSVFGEFDGEAVKWALVQTGDESFHHLFFQN